MQEQIMCTVLHYVSSLDRNHNEDRIATTVTTKWTRERKTTLLTTADKQLHPDHLVAQDARRDLDRSPWESVRSSRLINCVQQQVAYLYQTSWCEARTNALQQRAVLF